jgi:hypothetical protein
MFFLCISDVLALWYTWCLTTLWELVSVGEELVRSASRWAEELSRPG